ncbi:MAG: ornithine cyclodeaminase family protein [Gemmatimonadota bacterium]|nr:ornithine cyclodeaminase family protein [Gemmatimonadota bacterium]
MPTLLLSDYDVRKYLPMAECIDVMADALKSVSEGASILPLRTVIRLPNTLNAFASMPAVLGEGDTASIGAKLITVFPGNDATPFDSHIGVVLLFDAKHGALQAVADASSITSIRTAAVSGLATRLLANEDASELAILGAGVLAMTHVEAVLAVRPIKRVRVWSRSGARAYDFATQARLRWEQLEIVVCEHARDAVGPAHVVCTVTSSRTPVLEGGWLAPGTHVNAVGASISSARELDSDAVTMARLYVDKRESTMAEAGDFLIPKSEGHFTDSHIIGELGELLLQRVAGRTDRTQITLFKSLGLAVEDVAALRHIYQQATAANAGTNMVFGGLREGH